MVLQVFDIDKEQKHGFSRGVKKRSGKKKKVRVSHMAGPTSGVLLSHEH